MRPYETFIKLLQNGPSTKELKETTPEELAEARKTLEDYTGLDWSSPSQPTHIAELEAV